MQLLVKCSASGINHRTFGPCENTHSEMNEMIKIMVSESALVWWLFISTIYQTVSRWLHLLVNS